MVDSPFVWGAGGAQLTPEQIAAQRKIADAMMMRAGDYSPVQSWTQGAARVAEGLVGGLRARSADVASQENAAAEAQLLASLMPGAVPALMPATAPVADSNAAVALPPPVASRNVAPSRIYSNDEPSPLDPPSGADRARLAATILGESANQPAVGQNAVASVIRSRAVNGGYGGDTPSGVVTAKNQFEPWNTEAGRAKMAAMLANPALAAKAEQAIALAYGEGGQAPNDPTNGALNFIEPKLQSALGRPMPAWAQKPGVMIGDHKFIGGAPQTAVAAAEDPAALPPAAQPAQGYAIPGQPSPAVAQVAAAMPDMNKLLVARANPNLSESTRKVLDVLIAQKAKTGDRWIDERGEDGSFYQRNAVTNERKVIEKSDVLPQAAIDQKLKLAAAGKPETTVNVGGGSDKQVFDAMDESTKAARATATGLTGLREARNAIQGGAITGAGADARLNLQKAASFLGVANSDKIVNTETFRAAIAPQVAAVLKSTVGTANISNTDREFAEKAAGGNINLDEKSITRLLDIMEKASTAQLTAHQKRLDAVYPDATKNPRERALFGVDAPPVLEPVKPVVAPPDRASIEQEMRRRGLLK